MLVSYSTLTILAAALASAAPLNINLGAYSPALVVGDGEISFAGGAAGAQQLVSTLQGASQNGAAAAANGAAAAPAAAAPAAPGAVQAGVLSEKASLPIPGVTKELDPRLKTREDETAPAEGNLMKRQSGFDRALTFAEAALVKGPKVQLGTGEGGSGVGIIVDNNQQAAARVGTGAAAK